MVCKGMFVQKGLKIILFCTNVFFIPPPNSKLITPNFFYHSPHTARLFLASHKIDEEPAMESLKILREALALPEQETDMAGYPNKRYRENPENTKLTGPAFPPVREQAVEKNLISLKIRYRMPLELEFFEIPFLHGDQLFRSNLFSQRWIFAKPARGPLDLLHGD